MKHKVINLNPDKIDWGTDTTTLFKNVKCCGCGSIMPLAEGLDENNCICYNCSHIRPNYVGNQVYAHWDDDPSGASDSWDLIVKLYEERMP